MGGAAGHMNHPFDLGWVNTGASLLDFFDKAQTFVQKEGAGSVKIDGVNVSFKVVMTPDGNQFAVDRGSMKEIDISGITNDRVDQRFPEGHGMRPAIKTLLAILNESIGDTEPELIELGMWDDPSKFLNTEYVAGTTNVTAYDTNFLAIHGLNQFYQRTAKAGASKGNVRPGLERPEGVKAPSREIPYSENVMESFINKLQPYANKYGFEVYGSVPTSSTSEVDFSSTLAEPFTVKVSDDKEITKTLGEWLQIVENPRYKTIKLKNGKKTHPLHKDLYRTILQQTIPIVDLVEEENAEDAINGAIFMHATRMLGNDVLRSLSSPMGDVMNHEGIVIRDEEIFGPNPVKITGEFILGGMGSAFQQDTSLTEEDEQIEENQTIAIIPGAFKPPHKGHADMVRSYSQIADKVIVLISKPVMAGRKLPNGREITASDSEKIWNMLLGDMPNVEIEVSSHASPITAAYDYVGKDGPLNPGTKVILGASNKGGDASRWKGAEKYIKPGVILLDPFRTAVEPINLPDGTPYSATAMRKLLGAVEDDPEAWDKLEEFVGKGNVKDLLDILGLDAFMDIDEMSAAGAGGLQGAPGAIGKRDDEEGIITRKLQTENNVTVDEIMRLIMERGILQ